MRIKRVLVLFFCVLFAALLSGCSQKGVDELYKLPQHYENFPNLQNKINEIINSGAEYAAPSSGANCQSVQLYDIDGDGSEEVMAFFMQANEEKPLKIYIFTRAGDSYETAAVIDGEGTAIDSISYNDLNGDSVPEIIVGWKISSELQMLSVYSMIDLVPASLLTENYSQYLIGDMNRDNVDDLIVLEYNTLEFNGAVSLYTFDINGQVETYSDNISPGITAVNNMERGVLRNGFQALYIEGTYNQDGQDKVITDIFTLAAGSLKNITADENGISSNTLTAYPVSWTPAIGLNDINDDGVLEIPQTVMLHGSEESGTNFYVIRWYNFSIRGDRTLIMTTYHNYADSWYVEIPDDWSDKLSLRRVDEEAGEREIVFSFIENDQAVDFMIIYTFTGESKEDRAEMEGLTVLSTDGDKIIAAQILDELSDGLSMEELISRFSVIKTV